MPSFNMQELKWREMITVPHCMKTYEYDQGGKSRFHPLTNERLYTEADSPTPFVRVAYADAWGISLKDLEPYTVMKKHNLCHTKGCCNPLHWRVYPKPKYQNSVPRVPFWLSEALKGERRWLKETL